MLIVMTGANAQETVKRIRPKVLNVLKESGSPMSRQEICAVVQEHPESMRRTLVYMRTIGELGKVGGTANAKYFVSENAPEVVIQKDVKDNDWVKEYQRALTKSGYWKKVARGFWKTMTPEERVRAVEEEMVR